MQSVWVGIWQMLVQAYLLDNVLPAGSRLRAGHSEGNRVDQAPNAFLKTRHAPERGGGGEHKIAQLQALHDGLRVGCCQHHEKSGPRSGCLLHQDINCGCVQMEMDSGAGDWLSILRCLKVLWGLVACQMLGPECTVAG